MQGKTTAPFDYAKDQAQKIILHKRKQELLERWKEDLYLKEMRRENIKIVQWVQKSKPYNKVFQWKISFDSSFYSFSH